jgi:cyclopropane fatty-acyl-phospholipid synthase-like methyltransferase
MGRTDADFLEGGADLLRQVREAVTIGKQANVLDIGSGYGRLPHALWRSGHRGRYHGMDILAEHVAWCTQVITPATRGRYTFEHLDLVNDRYNPAGTQAATEVTITCPFRADVILLTSVFTHMYADAIDHYLTQLSALLEPTGAVYATIFFMNDSQAVAQEKGGAPYPLRHDVGPWSRAWNKNDPLHVIAHDEAWFRDRADAAGLHVTSTRYGFWCGRTEAEGFQDSIVMRPT